IGRCLIGRVVVARCRTEVEDLADVVVELLEGDSLPSTRFGAACLATGRLDERRCRRHG
ncbi:hypothetical protein ACLOJK_004115, partial [Asimina triloba]